MIFNIHAVFNFVVFALVMKLLRSYPLPGNCRPDYRPGFRCRLHSCTFARSWYRREDNKIIHLECYFFFVLWFDFVTNSITNTRATTKVVLTPGSSRRWLISFRRSTGVVVLPQISLLFQNFELVNLLLLIDMDNISITAAIVCLRELRNPNRGI
jgi:hypothetical protein